MPKDFSRLEIGMPDFGDRELFLKACGLIVVNEMIKGINEEKKPDGTPQKQNTEDYRERKKKIKGYTTPLKGISKISPYLSRPSGVAFTRAFFPPDRLEIFPNTKRYMIMVYVQTKGYWFMGITKEAERKIKDRTAKYFKNKIREMKTGNRVLGMQRSGML